MPPKTAAVKARSPASKPRSNLTLLKYRPKIMPPAAASTAPMKNVAEIVRLMSMPMSWAASRSWAVARIALPSFALLIKSESKITRTIAVRITTMSLAPIEAEPTSESRVSGSTSG